MEESKVIPTPARQRWREFRIRFLPMVVFLCTMAGIAHLWRHFVSPPTLIGQVEPLLTQVRTRDAGTISNLFVSRFQAVRAGDVIAAVLVTDLRRFDTELQTLRGEISVAQLELSTLVDRERLAFNYQDLQNEYMRRQTELQIARAELPHAEFDVNLSSNLLREKVVSEFDYRRYLSIHDSLKAQIQHLTEDVDQIQAKLEQSKVIGDLGAKPETARAIGARLSSLREQLARLISLGNEPLLLRAPIDGIVTSVFHHAGEAVMAGESVVSISAPYGERIVGYLHQPYWIQPKAGMTVHIRTRSGRRLEAESQISGVGASFEVITNAAFIRPNAPHELGLPLAFTIPPSLRAELRPGEIVDVTVLE